MNASSSVATPRALIEARRRIGRQHASRIHQRNPVAALGFVHEMGRDENRHALIAREIDQQFPEPVARQRVDARGRLVEDQHLRLVDNRDGKRKPLADAERQIQGAMIEIIGEAEALDQFGDARLRLARRQVEQARVKIEVLPHRQLGVERERLRHVADPIARSSGRLHRAAGRTAAPRLRWPATARSASSSSSSCRSHSTRQSRRSRRVRS